MALDWSSAEGYTRGLAHTGTSRLSTLPRDVIDTIAPYLHTYTQHGHSCQDDKFHGINVRIQSGYYGVYEMRNSKPHNMCKWWHADGSMDEYSEYNMGRMLFQIVWSNRIHIYNDGEWAFHDTLPAEYRWVWEVMTQTI